MTMVKPQYSGERKDFPIHRTGLNGYPRGIKCVLTTTSCHIHKSNQEKQDINVKGKKESFLEKNRRAPYDQGVGKDFLK